MVKLDLNAKIKSKNAECLLNEAKQSNIAGCPVSLGVAIGAVIIAEQEAEERHEQQLQELKDRAVEAVSDICPCVTNNRCDCKTLPPYFCDKDCDYIRDFTQKLTDHE